MSRATYTSCYRAICISCGESVFILEFEMSESAFVHAFLFVIDMYQKQNTEEEVSEGIFDFDIYIGNSADYQKNKYCGNYDS